MPTRYRILSDDDIAVAQQVYEAGQSLAVIGSHFGVADGTVLNVFRRAGASPRGPGTNQWSPKASRSSSPYDHGLVVLYGRRSWHNAPRAGNLARMASESERESALETANLWSRESQRVLGANLVAVILYGSLVSGDFVANKSDIDLLVIVDRPLADEQKRSLESAVTSLARGRRIDYRVVTSDVALHPPRMPTCDFYIVVHPGLPERVEIERAPIGEPVLLFKFAICREDGRSLVGPASTEVIGSVPSDWLVDVGDADLKRWQESGYDDRDAEEIVLTACRVWYRHDNGRHCTKSEAARWVTRHAPYLLAPRNALELRTADSQHPISRADVMTLLAKVREVISERPPG